jgi:membrane protease YdiL (CAAX protease family)
VHTNVSCPHAIAGHRLTRGPLAGSLAAVAKSGMNSENGPVSKKPTPSSRTNGPTGGSRVPKGRVPVASTTPKRSRRFLGGSAPVANEVAPNSSSDSDGSANDVTEATSSKKKYAYGGGALILIFIGAQLVSSVVYGIVQSRTTYDFTAPAGVGAAVGQASSQFSSGQIFAIAVPPPLWLTALMQIPLWLGLGGAPIWFAIKKGKGVVADLGLRMKAIDVPIGLAIGVACQLLLVPLVYFALRPLLGENDVSAAARELTDRATDPLSIVLVFLIVGIGAPVAEEIYFRGMAQRIFGRRLGPWAAILGAAAFFAATHLQPLQFPALLVFGVILGFMAWRSGRIGPAIWAHVGFNVVAATGLLFHIGPT